MANDKLQDGAQQTRLQNESNEYLSKREELRIAEIESMKLRERVAELRRHLPPGSVVKDEGEVCPASWQNTPSWTGFGG